jgi:threonine aldolase
MKPIDLRSDTAALPTEGMFDAMRAAELGDDVLGEDVNVRKLEETAARMFGKEAALLVSTGSMANQVAVMVYTQRGQEVIVGAESHMYNLEGAGLAALSQVQARPVSCPKGYFDPAKVAGAIQGTGVQSARTGLICLENTYNLNRGYVMSLENIAEIASLATKNGIPVYMDGARIFNAAAALGIEAEEIARHVDAVQFCMTKGLGAPFGSLLMGRNEFIREARIVRQRIGGGIRHLGLLNLFSLGLLSQYRPGTD